MMAAASYAPPTMVYSSDRHGHGHGRHVHSLNSKSTAQRVPLQNFTNGGSLRSGGSEWNVTNQANGHLLPNPLRPLKHTHFTTSDHAVQLEVIHQEHPDSESSQPETHDSITTFNNRSKSMERRRSSAGLPTHLRLGSSGYGFPVPSSPKYLSSNDGEARWDLVRKGD
jgi:hypothetical protein